MRAYLAGSFYFLVLCWVLLMVSLFSNSIEFAGIAGFVYIIAFVNCFIALLVDFVKDEF